MQFIFDFIEIIIPKINNSDSLIQTLKFLKLLLNATNYLKNHLPFLYIFNKFAKKNYSRL
jgi:hypothetical protein